MYLRRIEIENLRAIRELTLDFGTTTQTRRWTVLLGENGCGKSTVLKAIGLVLAGSDALAELLEDPDAWVRNGAKIARVRAEITTAQGETRNLLLEIHRGDRRDSVIRRNQKGLALLDAAIDKADRNYFVAGYGAFRRPPDPLSSSKSGRRARISRADNIGTLFSAASELMSVEQWAFELDYREGKEGRKVIAEALGSLLPGMSFSRIDKKEFAIWMNTQDGEVRLPTDAALKRLIARICPDPATVTDSELLKKWFNEDSDLPNPYLEDPEKLFAWAVSEVNQEVHLVAPNNAKPRAKRAVNAAVEYLGLNRETLTRSRFVVYNELQFALYVWQEGTREAKIMAKLQVERMCRSDRQYTGMARFFAKEAGFPL
jgi:energy-coupling factor transporter ATP-binding protein EcfA2